MATNHNNEFCVQCETFTYKGDGVRLEHQGSWRTFCMPCGNARQENKVKAVKKAAYIKQQPQLFPEEVTTMKAPFKVGDRVRSIQYSIMGTVKWVKFEPNGVMVNRPLNSRKTKWGYVQKIEKGGYTVAVNWDSSSQGIHYPYTPNDLQNAKALELMVQEPPMTSDQIGFIRDLFKANKEFMTIDEQESLINKMKGHLDGSSPLTTKWGIAALKKLNSYNTERSAS